MTLKELMFKHVKIVRLPNRASQETIVEPRSDCEHGDREFVGHRRVSPHEE